ncbi:MAG: queuosine precursor transporter [Bdellovibrionales bacterium]|nr:queuosine precursor transporter [Bdellovibrionales bacterium]
METFDRKERVFLILAAVFLSSMTLLNVIGITRFIELGPLQLAVGVLPYPLTFLCTDLISEVYGKQRANFLVWVGLGINALVIAIMYLGQLAPSVPLETQPPWQALVLKEPVVLATGQTLEGAVELFQIIYSCTAGAVFASMVAYIAAQFCDVWLFHFWKRVTKGKHLWVRNNFSTMISQLVDSVAVIGVTFGTLVLSGKMPMKTALTLIGANYLFKVVAAALDTGPLYLCVYGIKRYLGQDQGPAEG